MSIVEVLRSKFSDIPHTPTPWVMEEQWSGLALKPGEGARHTICKIHGTSSQDLADALFILTAINTHDELVAAERCRAFLEGRGPMTQYEITHGCHPDPSIAFVKRSPHTCEPLGEHKCVSVSDEIALISSLHEHEMVEIVRRSNTHDELVAALDAVSRALGSDMAMDDDAWIDLHKQVYRALSRARGEQP